MKVEFCVSTIWLSPENEDEANEMYLFFGENFNDGDLSGWEMKWQPAFEFEDRYPTIGFTADTSLIEEELL